MSVFLLAKVAGMSTAVSTALGSFVYYSFKDTRLREHLKNIALKDERIDELQKEQKNLSVQLGISKKPILFRFICAPEDLATERQLDWTQNSFEVNCKTPSAINVNKKPVS